MLKGKKTGTVQLIIEILKAVAFSFVSVEVQLHPEERAQFMEKENPACAGSGQQQLAAFFPKKITKDALRTSQIEDNICGLDIKMCFENLEFLHLT